MGVGGGERYSEGVQFFEGSGDNCHSLAESAV